MCCPIYQIKLTYKRICPMRCVPIKHISHLSESPLRSGDCISISFVFIILAFDNCLQACHHVSNMIELLDEDTTPKGNGCLLSKTPQFLSGQLRRALVGLARLPKVNGFARTPPIIWKMGWSPSPLERAKTELPPIPLEFLKEKAVLRSFIQRVNTIGRLKS